MLLSWKFPLLIEFCSSSHLPMQWLPADSTYCQQMIFLTEVQCTGWEAAQQTLLYPHHHAPNQTDTGRTPTCWGGAVVWLQLEMTQNSVFPLPLQQQNCPRSLRPHGSAMLWVWSCSFLGSLCSQICHKPQYMVTACKLCEIQTLNSDLIQNLQLGICFHLCHAYLRCFTVIYLEGYEKLQEQRYKLSSKGQIKVDAISPKVCYFFPNCFQARFCYLFCISIFRTPWKLNEHVMVF